MAIKEQANQQLENHKSHSRSLLRVIIAGNRLAVRGKTS